MPRPFRALALTGLVSASLLAGHAVAYAFVGPPAERHELLAVTGHGYLPSATTVALAALIAGATTLFGMGFVAAGKNSRHLTLAAPAKVAAGQAAAFFVLEVVERLVAGAPVGELFGPLLAAGLVVQALLGAATGAGAWLLLRAGERLAEFRSWTPPVRPASGAALPPAGPSRAPAGWPTLRPARAPPAL